MSYIPLRDRYHFDEDTNERLEALAVLAERDHLVGNHEDACNCSDPNCRTLNGLSFPTAEEVLAFALSRGWLTLPVSLSLADAQALAAIEEAGAA